MLDIEPKWFLTLVVIFLANLVILNAILFKPMLKVFKERENAIDGALDEAKDMEMEKDNKLVLFKREISDAAQAAKGKFEDLRLEGSDKQRELMEAAAKEAAGLIDKARAELSAESEKARTALKGDVEKFSDAIVEKLLKV